MKKLTITFLCLLFTGLCACQQGVRSEEKATTTTRKSGTEEPKPIITIKTSEDDPFSTIISDQVNWLMEKYIETNDIHYYERASEQQYSLYDINGNGTTALLLGWENSNGQVGEIYTAQNNVAEQRLSVFEDAGDSMIYVLKNGCIYTEQADGSGTKGYYRFEDGQLKLVAGLGYYGDIDGSVFRVDPTGEERDYFFDFIPDGTEVPISDEEGRRLYKELVGDGQLAELDWKPLAEYGR